jgi:putative FmdB family regulatory protein
MPTYEYKCPSCGHTFECLQPMDADKTAACLRCPSKAKRMIGSGCGVHFKGSGFYETDYKNKRE